MAYTFGDFTRPVTPSYDYPDGDIKDNPSGTLVNRRVLTDLLQTFHKLMRLAGITANSTPDNESNGFQFIQAMDYRFVRAFTSTGVTFSSVGAGPWTWTNKGAPYYNVGFSVRGNMVALCGVATITNTSGGPGALTLPVFTLPAGARPSSSVLINNAYAVGGTAYTQILIDTAGVVSISFGNSGAGGDVSFDGIEFRIS